MEEVAFHDFEAKAFVVTTGKPVRGSDRPGRSGNARSNEMHSPELDTAFESLLEVKARFSASGISLERVNGSHGLPSGDVEELLRRDGYNELTPPERKSEWVLLLKQLANPFMILLGAAGVLSFIAYGIDPSQTLNAVLGGVLFGVVLVTVLMSWSQERKTIKTMAAFRNILPSSAVVIRNGKQQDAEARTLVVGDIVLLSLGQKVPADVRLLSSSSLKVENGAITGESEPVELDASVVHERGVAVEEARNLTFNGSLILDGSGIGVVLATGDRSLIGRIASLTTRTEVRKSTMEIEVERFVRFISILAIAMAVVFFVIDVGRRSGVGALNSFINGFLVIIVANVPQGLPATVTSLQLIVAKRLASQNVFVKRLDAVETLGAITVICSDKTGTLTMNKMTVVDGWVNCEVGLHFFSEALLSSQMRASAVKMHEGSTERLVERALPSVTMLQLIACVCNNAVASVSRTLSTPQGLATRSDSDDDDQLMTMGANDQATIFSGNPSEVALLTFFESFCPGIIQQLRNAFPVILEIPFNSSNKFHAVVVAGSFRPGQKGVAGNVLTTFMKGAPEVLLMRCSRYIRNGEVCNISREFKDGAFEAYQYFARRGQRVLGFCMREFECSDAGELNARLVPLEDMTFVGMLAIMDPPRPDVAGAIVKCRAAGVKVFMVTGDHPVTAAAIAGQIGLLPENLAVRHYEAGTHADYEEADVALVIHGQQIERFSEEDWSFVLTRRNLVFARTTPQHKLLITEKCQERKEVVCMTGDGVNDAPALKRADIGVSMGINGSEVAREASDVILMDDNFASIVLGVESGRQLFDNLKKTIAYTLCHLAPEIVPVLLTLALGFPPLLSSLQILSVDLFTELAPAISLAYERKERDIMEQPPRNLQRDRLVSAPLLSYAYLFSGLVIEAAACFLGSSIVFWTHGISLSSIVFNNGFYFVPANPMVIVPGWQVLCSGTNCFSPAQQVVILQQAAGAWYILLISSQVLHIWMVKTRRISLFKHAILGNMVMNYGVVIEACLMMVFVAIPGLNTVLMGAQLPPGLAVLPLLYSGIALWAFNEGRKWYIRRKRKSLFARVFFW